MNGDGKMDTLTGFITSEIKCLKFSPILMRFELTDQDGNKYNVLIHQHALNFFEKDDRGSLVKLTVRKNKRNQYVVNAFKFLN